MRGLKLMAVLARPDEEYLGRDGALARYAAQGAETYVALAGFGDATLQELRAEFARLPVRATYLVASPGERVDELDPAVMVERLAEHIRMVRPEAVVTDRPTRGGWDPDRTALAELTEDALVAAADPHFRVPSGLPAHRVWIIDSPLGGGDPTARVA